MNGCSFLRSGLAAANGVEAAAPTAGLRWRAPESEIAPKEGEVTQTLSLRNSRIKGAAALRPWLVRMRVRILYADHGMSSQNGSNEELEF